uniref:G2/mitotic-specific cyclin-2-like n=1 Tax=Erigeron canadensis TaxID=72917 RepID=UPI001CB8EE55|nr:G2/mitotic-specific cyclin-2-like [Erigeron canadensis]
MEVEVPSASEPPPKTEDVIRAVESKNGKSKTHTHTPFLRCPSRPPRISRLRRKVKVQFRIPNSRRNGGSGRQTFPINYNNNERKLDDYLRIRQPKVSIEKRKALVDWLFDMHCREFLEHMTALAAVDIFDRFLSEAQNVVSIEEVDYVAVAAMHIATKYHETQLFVTLSLDELIQCVNGGLPDPNGLHRYRGRVMEKRILDELGWKLEVPTVYTFIHRFLNAAIKNPLDLDPTLEEMLIFYAKLGIWNYQLMITYPLEMLAAAAIYAACAFTCNMSMWQDTVRDHTGFKDTQLLACSKRMLELHWVGHEDCNWWIPFNSNDDVHHAPN